MKAFEKSHRQIVEIILREYRRVQNQLGIAQTTCDNEMADAYVIVLAHLRDVLMEIYNFDAAAVDLMLDMFDEDDNSYYFAEVEA